MLVRKMLRDMKLHKIQFLSIFLMAFLALFIYSGLGGESKGYEVQLDQYYKECNFADVWLYSNHFAKEDQEKVAALDEVTSVQRRFMIENVTANLSDNPALFVYFEKENTVNQMYVVEGNSFDPADKDGLWLDSEFASARNLKVGDKLKLNYEQMTLEKTIRGIVMNPEYIYMKSPQMLPDHYMNGFAYLSYEALPAGVPEIMNEMILTVDSSRIVSMQEFENELYELLQPDAATGSKGLTIFLARDHHTSHLIFTNEIEERKAMTAVLPIAFLAIALLTIMTTMTRIVQNQRTQIGILKALGFQKRRIIFHYLFYSLFLTGAGGLLGTILGPLSLPPLFQPAMKTTFTLPQWKGSFLPSSIPVLLLCVACACLITYLACHKILKESPAQQLRPKAPKTSRLTRLERSRFWMRRGFTTQWNLRDIMRSKARSFMAVAGVAGCLGLLLACFGCLDAFQEMIRVKFDDICKYDYKYTLNDTISEDTMESTRAAVNGQLQMMNTIEVKSETSKELTELTVNDQSSLYQYLGESFEPISIPESGISLSKMIAQKLNVSVGDTIKWHKYGEPEWITAKVAAIYRDPAEQGVAMSRNGFEKQGFEFRPRILLSGDAKRENLEGVTTIESKEDSRKGISDMLDKMYLLIGVAAVLAGLLAVVVLYHLSVLSFTEKERELATLKVIGFQTVQIRRLLFQQNLWLSLLGLIPGYYFGIFVVKSIMVSMGSEFDLPLKILPGSLMICVLFTMSLSLLVNFFFSGRVKKLDMVASLKGVE